MADIEFRVDWDITPAEQKQNKLQREFEESEAKLKRMRDEHQKTLEAIEQEKKKQAEITEELEKRALLAEQLEKKYKELTPEQKVSHEGIAVQSRLEELYASMDRLDAERDKSYATQEKLEQSSARETLELQKQENKTKNIAENIAVQNTNTEKTAKNTKKTTTALDGFKKRLLGIAKQIFIFSLITKALNALKKLFTEKINSDSGLAKYLSQIKGNLAVIGQTLYSTARPIIEWILQKVAYLTQLLSVILARALKKDAKEMANMAKQSGKTAKNSEKTLASWDTLQQIKDNNGSSSSDVAASYDQFDMQKWTDEQLTKIEALAAGALLALGVILCFSGINIPLGIALIAAGAALLATEVVPNWNALSDETKLQLAKITAIASAALLALGIILCIFQNYPLGIALIALGVVGLVTAAVIALNTLPDDVKREVSKIMAIAGAAMLALGVILCIFGVIPLGVALIVAGAASLIAAAVANKDKVIAWITEKLNIIKDLFARAWDYIWDKWGDKITSAQHALADFLNKGINLINNLLSKVLSTGWASTLFNALGVDTSNWRIPPVPYLAKGAVIPGGSPFMAVLGDQPRGRTNVEAPEELIRQIVREESGNININFNGSLAQLARVLNPEITREQNRSSLWTEARV